MFKITGEGMVLLLRGSLGTTSTRKGYVSRGMKRRQEWESAVS